MVEERFFGKENECCVSRNALKRLRTIDEDLQVPDCRKFKEHTGWELETPFEKLCMIF